MQAWFPANATMSSLSSGDANEASHQSPRALLLCFHGAGSDGSMFTSKGTAKRPLPNPLVSYCVDNDIRILAAHLPGRTSRLKEPRMTSALEIAETVFDLLAPLLSPSKSSLENRFEFEPNIPLVVAGHSMGAFIAYEFLCLMRYRNLPPAKHFLVSCMVAPDMPKHLRPWRPTEHLLSEEVKDECRLWGVNEEVFNAEVWKIYHPILKKDFSIIDNYVFCEPDKGGLRKTPQSTQSTTPSSSPMMKQPVASFHAPLGISTTAFFAEYDNRVTEEHVRKWKNIMLGSGLFATSPSGFGTKSSSEAEFHVEKISAGHNFFYEAEPRIKWMEVTIQVLDRLLIDLEYGF